MSAMPETIPILTFHSLDDRGEVISFPPRLFRRGITKLREHGYTALSLHGVADSLGRGDPLPERSVIITFDDGYGNFYAEALPVLQECRMTATVFVIAGTPSGGRESFEGRELLSWQQIREMHQRGIEIGSHTLTHPDLTKISQNQIESEIHGSKKLLEDRLGAPIHSFCYPFGRYDTQSRQLASQTYDCACSDRLGLTLSGSDLYTLDRVDAYYLRKEKLFDLMLSRLFPAYIWSRSVPRRFRRRILSHR
jgi:peptidoglycan/xylan/chitin deacetylase (PgdA/CDA1 family)